MLVTEHMPHNRRWALALTLTGIIGLLLFGAVRQAWGASVAALVKEGNRLYDEKKYEQALASYDAALEQKPEAGYIQFNRGNALYRLGRYGEALDSYRKAAGSDDADEIGAMSAYNMGNTAYRLGDALQNSNPGKALEQTQDSIAQYRRALDDDPRMEEAARNLELAKVRAVRLRELLQQQKAAAQQDAKQKQDSNQALQDMIRKQEALRQDTGQAAQEQQSKEAGANKGQDLEQRQNEAGEQTRKLADNMDGQDKDLQENLAQAADRQQMAAENLRNKKFDKAAENQEQALDNLRKSLAQLRQQEQKDQSSAENNKNQAATTQHADNGQQQESSQPPPAINEAGDNVPPPDQSALDVLNWEQQNQQFRRQRDSGRNQAVDKDW